MTETTLAPAPAPATGTASEHHHVLIVGGGTAGITLGARLRRTLGAGALAIVEPSERHYYQPLWTLAGGGVVDKRASERREESLIPAGATWIRDAASRFEPDESAVVTSGGRRVTYDVLVVAPGIRIDWDAIPGLVAGLADGSVCSIYAYDTVDRAWERIRDFPGGTAVFTFPGTPVKCPGAAQKIMYLADDHWRRTGVRGGSRIVFGSAAPGIYGVERYAKTLRRVVERKGIETWFRHELVEIRSDAREAVFESLESGERVTVAYDLLHVTPRQSAPDVVARSPLAGEGGWLELDEHTLQHARYPNVFGLGDAAGLPTAKTAAAVRAQAKVVARNVAAAVAGEPPPARYDGYTACPIVTGYGKLVLAEFDYDLVPRETFPFDQSKERWSMYQLKKRGLPLLYWQGMMRGRA